MGWLHELMPTIYRFTDVCMCVCVCVCVCVFADTRPHSHTPTPTPTHCLHMYALVRLLWLNNG